MKSLYASPLRVYLCLGLLALAGVYSGLKLPVSLFPNSAQPRVFVSVPYAGGTPENFVLSHGVTFEGQLSSITTSEVEVEEVEANYGAQSAQYNITFKWGSDPQAAYREVDLTARAFSARLTEEARRGLSVGSYNSNTGFFAMSFYSDERGLDAIYKELEPVLVPRLAQVRDAEGASLWNPEAKEVRLELQPEKLALLQLMPRQVEAAVRQALESFDGGSLTVGQQSLQIQMPREAGSLEALGSVLISTPGGKAVHLSDVAKIDFGPVSGGNQSFRTNGAPSLILFARPKNGGNVKRMSEEILAEVRAASAQLSPDIQSKVLVDPSEFIRASISNVLKEVAIGAGLAVIILYLFIGSLRNTVTAAIEIPLSMVLAFILMRFSGMNMNLISLGGLALSAGMNVDGSVVVMENIFRHFEERRGQKLSPLERLRVLIGAVQEVRFPLIASTVASLVVFVPLAFTSGLSYAILGDLAMAVVFSHGLSAIVALILVPTVRLQLMNAARTDDHPQAPIEGLLKRFENFYARALEKMIRSKFMRGSVYGVAIAAFTGLAVFGLPHLPREIIGKPDTDWLIVGVNTQGNRWIGQMETYAAMTESKLLSTLGDKVQYTFNQIHGANSAMVMARLRDKRDMRELQKQLETLFTNTATESYWVDAWNPAEMQIPDPPHFRVSVQGGTPTERLKAAREIRDLLQEGKLYDRVYANPSVERQEQVNVQPRAGLWQNLGRSGSTLQPSDLLDIARTASAGRQVGQITLEGKDTEIMMRYPEGFLRNVEDLAALPIGIGSKLVPLKALASVEVQEVAPEVFRKNRRELFEIKARLDQKRLSEEKSAHARATDLIAQWKAKNKLPVGVLIEDSKEELTGALEQLAIAVGLSIVLMFVTLVLQFGNLASAALVMVAVPLGLIGVFLSLLVFQSTLSLNSVLGVILLNGIAVANSILLVEFLRRRVSEGVEPELAAIEAARARLRPILITSLTTILGMMPIALGLGEGGRILQPLGIAVSGGLWVSMLLTLLIVPTLQVSWERALVRRTSRQRGGVAALVSLLLIVPLGAQAKKVDFDAAIEQVLARSTGVETARAQLESAQAAGLPTRLVFLPTVEAALNQTHAGPSNSGEPARSRSWQLISNLNLFRFGADVQSMRAATRFEDARATHLEGEILRAEQAAIVALSEELRDRLEVAIYEKRVSMERESLDIAKARFKKGLLANQELIKVELDLENAQARLVNARIQESRSRARLQALLGQAGEGVEWGWRERLEKMARASKFPWDQASPEVRPDLRSARLTLEQQELLASAAWRKALPSLNLTGAYGSADAGTGTWRAGWSLGVSVSWSLFDRLEGISSARQMGAARVISEQAFIQASRDAAVDIEDARASFKIALDSAFSRERLLGRARALYGDNQRRFQMGRISANELTVELDRLLDVELFAIQGWASAHQELGRVCHAIGKRVKDCGI
jgi:HAE1 family hydrophobic/amphiphilic exporter-1